MKKILFCITYNDYSPPYFLNADIKSKIKPEFLLYEDSNEYIEKYLKSNEFDYIYLRTPFVDENLNDISEIKGKIKIILDNRKGAYIVDNIKTVDDVLFEDKWRQYELLSEFMPETRVMTDGRIDFNKKLLKLKISSRGKGVFFEVPEGIDYNDYIVQDRVDIENEYRIYSIFDEIVEVVEIKSSKTETAKFKVMGTENISDELYRFVKNIKDKVNFDFAGYDVVRDKEGKYHLLEINMSCLFGAFYRETKINLAERFIGELIKRK